MFIEQADAIDKGELNMTIYSKYNEVRNAYLSSLKMITQSVATYDKYETVLNDFGKFLEQNCGKVEQTDISPLMVLNYKEEATKRGIKRNTLRHYLIILRSFFKWCVEHKFYAEQPIFESDIPKSERIEYNLLTEQQIETILRGEIPKWSKMATAKRNRALVILLIQSGLRISELINLRIKDLDFEQHTIRVSHGKGDKLRYTTLPPLAEQFVKEYLDERFNGNYDSQNEHLFANENGEPFTRQNITQIVRAYVNRTIGRNDIGAHDLRHAYASYMITHGMTLEDIQKLLGHSSYATTVIYASHLCPKRISKNANNIWSNIY